MPTACQRNYIGSILAFSALDDTACFMVGDGRKTNDILQGGNTELLIS